MHIITKMPLRPSAINSDILCYDSSLSHFLFSHPQLSGFPAMFATEFGLESLFSDSDTGFFPWDLTEPPFLFDTPFPDQAQEPVAMFLQEPITSSSGSDPSSPEYPITPESGSPKPNQNCTKDPSSVTSHAHEIILLASIMDERKRKRTQSNRESARRSRMRKQKHMEILETQVNRQKRENLELINQLNLVVSQNEAACIENELLRLEAEQLRQRLWDMRQVLLVRRLHQHLNRSLCMVR